MSLSKPTSTLVLTANDARSLARDRHEAERTDPYVADRQRILATTAFRRLAGKTQVFIHSSDDHHRTRLTHTLDVTDISREIARGLGLDEDLTEAIALGHDLGHAPFGHAGESGLDEFCEAHLGRRFFHREQSLRIVEKLAGGGEGLNLTAAVRDGILKHSGPNEPWTHEGMIVRTADRIAYLTHDVDDAVREGVIDAKDLPAAALAILGSSPLARRRNVIADMIFAFEREGSVGMSERTGEAFLALRAFMFERVYLSDACADASRRASLLVKGIAEHLYVHTDEIPAGDNLVDYISGMTGRFAIEEHKRITFPEHRRLGSSLD